MVWPVVGRLLADELWQLLIVDVCDDAEPSVHLTRYPVVAEALRDDRLLTDMAAVRDVVVAGRAAREQAQIKNRQPLPALLVATGSPALREVLNAYGDLVAAELSVKQVRLVASSQAFAQTEVTLPNTSRTTSHVAAEDDVSRGLRSCRGARV
ncbi:MAG: class I tRNA ligase family protein [Egibacteraceae bacterium]